MNWGLIEGFALALCEGAAVSTINRRLCNEDWVLTPDPNSNPYRGISP
jgi:hypothetical protein